MDEASANAVADFVFGEDLERDLLRIVGKLYRVDCGVKIRVVQLRIYGASRVAPIFLAPNRDSRTGQVLIECPVKDQLGSASPGIMLRCHDFHARLPEIDLELQLFLEGIAPEAAIENAQLESG